MAAPQRVLKTGSRGRAPARGQPRPQWHPPGASHREEWHAEWNGAGSRQGSEDGSPPPASQASRSRARRRGPPTAGAAKKSRSPAPAPRAPRPAGRRAVRSASPPPPPPSAAAARRRPSAVGFDAATRLATARARAADGATGGAAGAAAPAEVRARAPEEAGAAPEPNGATCPRCWRRRPCACDDFGAEGNAFAAPGVVAWTPDGFARSAASTPFKSRLIEEEPPLSALESLALDDDGGPAPAPAPPADDFWSAFHAKAAAEAAPRDDRPPLAAKMSGWLLKKG